MTAWAPGPLVLILALTPFVLLLGRELLETRREIRRERAAARRTAAKLQRDGGRL